MSMHKFQEGFCLSVIVTLIVFVPGINLKGQHLLHYQQPAEAWQEALPIGNGRMGAMVFGRPGTERIQLNEDSMWPDDLGWDNPDGTPEDLAELRRLLKEGQNALVDSLVVAHFSRKQIVRSHQTVGDLWIELDKPETDQYKRQLDLRTATTSSRWRSGKFEVKSTAFCSAPDQVLVITYETDDPDGMNARIRMSRPEDEGEPTAQSFTHGDNELILQGEVTQRKGTFDSKPAPIYTGVRFQVATRLRHAGGMIEAGPDYLQAKGVRKLVLLVTIQTSYYGEDYVARSQSTQNKLLARSVDQLHQRHVADHQSLYQRVELILDDAMDEHSSLPTDLRLNRLRSGARDPGMEVLLFHYGRYLLIASSRPGTNPANLQGLWNEHINAPWNADYHLNINLQMNYWLADVTNLSELNEPLMRYMDRLLEQGKKTARENFGCQGTFVPHATDLWAPTWMRAATAYWGASMGAGGWLAQHYWEHFAFTADTTFLRERAWPAIASVAQFYADWLIEDPRDGTLVSAPSTSPENRFMLEGKPVATCMGSAMDQQVIAEVFDHYLLACELLGEKTALQSDIMEKRHRLRPGMVLGSDGRVLEWDREYEEYEPGHRHMSHLYAFHPGTAVTRSAQPELFQAVRKTLDYRLEHGGAGPGWSRAWLINCSARLYDGEMAHEHIQLLFGKSMFSNLFDAHPPFQIDGNFGYTAGVAEMLLQSHEQGVLELLPALPEAWSTGSIKGLKGRGDFTVDMSWENGELRQVVIYAGKGGTCKVRYGDQILTKPMNAGDIWEPSFSSGVPSER